MAEMVKTTVIQNNDMFDVIEDKNHMEICDNCMHRSYCFVAGKKKEYCGNYTEMNRYKELVKMKRSDEE